MNYRNTSFPGHPLPPTPLTFDINDHQGRYRNQIYTYQDTQKAIENLRRMHGKYGYERVALKVRAILDTLDERESVLGRIFCQKTATRKVMENYVSGHLYWE